MFSISSLKNSVTIFTLLASFSLLLASCANTRKAVYFNDLKDSSKFAGQSLPETYIQPNDILNIKVSSLNPEATTIFNPTTTVTGETEGYLVEKDGTILFTMLGYIKAAGLTKEQLKLNITKSLIDNKLLVDPIVNVRFKNFRVTVLGEVKNPSVIPVPSERISMLEAIGLAGDLTISAKRNNVLLIREEKGEKITQRIDLNSSELFTSPYYYLKSNDIIYVEPNKARVASEGRGQIWVPAILSALSFLVIILDRAL